MDARILDAVALSIRTLSIDMVQKANSGHPGLPLGCAELGALLYGEFLNHDPARPDWVNRDRFVLSAGHGSAFLYSLLHLAGFGLSLDELRAFRQLGSKTPGHPEFGLTTGVETTTGPLGQGFANAVGLAIAETMLASRFNAPGFDLIRHFTYALAGDGCMMEGVTSEAASLAGHLGLGRLIAFYDSNRITIEGSTDLAFTEDVGLRFEGYGWSVFRGDMYDADGVRRMVEEAKRDEARPSLIILKSTIGRGSPHMAGSHETHGAPLGAEEVRATKKNLGVAEDAEFYVHPDVPAFFEARRAEQARLSAEWDNLFLKWSSAQPEKRKEWDAFFAPMDAAKPAWPSFAAGGKEETRGASGKALAAAYASFPRLVGGSADLGPSNKTTIPGMGDYSRSNRLGRTLHFGVREHAMGAVANGLALGGLMPFCATFLVFSDYMRPAIRLAALMKIQVVFVFTHDSIHVGEDGPTHQPIEQIASLRLIPNLRVLRPADAEESVEAWKMALERKDGPTALILTRQKVSTLEKYETKWREGMRRGAYIVYQRGADPEITVVATGSEVELALEAAKTSMKSIRVVSMPSKELFESQSQAFRDQILQPENRIITAEAGVTGCWTSLLKSPKDALSINRFGESGPGQAVADHFGLNVRGLLKIIEG